MNNKDDIRDLIPAFLNGELSAESKREFETALAEDQDLAEEVADIAQLRHGLALHDVVAADHIESETLALYAEDKSSLTKGAVVAIEKHLVTCADCRDELNMCRLAISAATSGTEEQPGLLARILRVIFPTRLSLQPTAAYVAVALLVVGTFFVTRNFLPFSPGTVTSSLSSTTLRGLETDNLITVTPEAEVVRLEVMLPTIENRYYDITVRDSADAPVMTLHHQRHAMPFVVEVPAEYLAVGEHSLLVVEESLSADDPSRPETFEIDFTVVIRQ